jgi:hypothetical protein
VAQSKWAWVGKGTTHSTNGGIYWFQTSPMQKKIQQIIVLLFKHCYIFELALDLKYGAKKIIRQLFLKELKAKYCPHIAII